MTSNEIGKIRERTRKTSADENPEGRNNGQAPHSLCHKESNDILFPPK
jgi:hypothetical protein